MRAYLSVGQEKPQTRTFVVTFADLNTTAGVAKAVVLLAYTAGFRILDACFRLVTPFDGTSTTALAMIVGWNGATTDDPDGLIEAIELHNDATEISFGGGTGVGFATKVTGYPALDAGNLEATFTATTANLTDLTSGEVHIQVTYQNLAKI